MPTRTLKLPADCPLDENDRRHCGDCLRDRLLVTPGIRGVQYHCSPEQNTATVELDYDPAVVTANQ